MTINQLEKELKENKLSSIYLLYGQERYLLDNVVKKIKKSFGNLVDGLNYIKIDNSAIDNIISEIQTPAFGFERKLIIIKNTDLLKKQSKKKNQLIIDKIEKISEYIENNKDEILRVLKKRRSNENKRIVINSIEELINDLKNDLFWDREL